MGARRASEIVFPSLPVLAAIGRFVRRGRRRKRGPQGATTGIALCLILFLASSGCAVEMGQSISYSENSTTAAERPLEIEIPELEKQIHALVNVERAKNGLSQLAWNPALNKIASAFSQDMATRGYFSHYSPEGYDFTYRYKQAGFFTRAGGGENLFQTELMKSRSFIGGISTGSEYRSQSDIASWTVDSWMQSPPHRQTILIPRWTSEGIGVAISPDGKVYVTQNFG